MKSLCIVFPLVLPIGLVFEITALPAAAQTASPKDSPPAAPGLRKLTGEDAKRAEELDKAIDAAVKADRWDAAIAKAQELVALRTQVQGLKHFEGVTAEWRLKTLRRVAPMPEADRVAYRSAVALSEQAQGFYDQAKYADAQALSEKALKSFRRLLTDQHPQTAGAYNTVAQALKGQAKYAAAQTLCERALEIQAPISSRTTTPTPR